MTAIEIAPTVEAVDVSARRGVGASQTAPQRIIITESDLGRH